jgi:hypothetical protein
VEKKWEAEIAANIRPEARRANGLAVATTPLSVAAPKDAGRLPHIFCLLPFLFLLLLLSVSLTPPIQECKLLPYLVEMLEATNRQPWFSEVPATRSLQRRVFRSISDRFNSEISSSLSSQAC